jgi:uridylate kinase
MVKKIIVISLGGSLIIPNSSNNNFLSKFKKTILNNLKKDKYVIVCGGGSIARDYISALKKQGKSMKEQALAGIRATRMNAKFMMQLFGNKSNEKLPRTKIEIKNSLLKNDIVISGALRYSQNETSDGTASKLANYFKTYLINISNVSGLYSSDPSIYKNAKFIPHITWKEFEKKTLKIKYEPGQHYILDQNSAKTIKKNQIITYLLGPDTKQLNNLLNGKKFKGTVISD